MDGKTWAQSHDFPETICTLTIQPWHLSNMNYIFYLTKPPPPHPTFNPHYFILKYLSSACSWKSEDRSMASQSIDFVNNAIFDLVQLKLYQNLRPLTLYYQKDDDKIFACEFSKNVKPKLYIILRIQRLKGKQCRSRWGGSSWATSSRPMLFANSAIFVSGAQRVKQFTDVGRHWPIKETPNVVCYFAWGACSRMQSTLL